MGCYSAAKSVVECPKIQCLHTPKITVVILKVK